MNRVALVTGVGPGLGAALARRFAREGFQVGLIARKADFIEALASEISASGRRAVGVVADVGRPAEAVAAVKQVRENLGPVGALIHNAGSAYAGGLLTTTPEEFERSWRVAALGGFVCARETAPDMLSGGGGVMLFTGATSSVRGGGWLGFSSAKFAVRGLVQSLARELWPRGVHLAHVVIDGLIAPLHSEGGQPGDEPFLDPDRITDPIGISQRRIALHGHLNSICGRSPSSSTSEPVCSCHFN
jgi:NAD(P)-dependent dehydrogenase (short-subunit alcohol dehydrogenase family)